MRYSVRDIAFVCLCVVALFGCGTPKKTMDEQLAAADWDKSQKKTVYLTDTKPAEHVGDPDKLVFAIDKIEANDYPNQVRLFVRVTDSSGSFVTNLAPPVHPNQDYWKKLNETLGDTSKHRIRSVKDFTVREYGDNDSIPYAINLLIDYSGSMGGVLDALYEGTELFIGLKQKQDMIAVSTFNKDFEVKVPFAADKSYLIDRFRRTREKGFGMYSALYDGLLKSIRMFDSLPATMPRILVAFSDGDDNFSQTRAATIFKEAQERNVHIYTVGFGYTQDDVLKYISENSGGKYYQVYTKKEMTNVFLEIYRSLRNYYLVTYTPPQFKGKHWVALNLQLPNSDGLTAKGMYDKSDITIFTDTPFTKKIVFDYNQATLKPESIPIIEELVDQLNSPENERVWLRVIGHTDNVGGVDYNQGLSERRANAVVDALVQRGIDTKRLYPVGKGVTVPIATNDTEEGRAKNRRTEFEVIRR